MLSDPVRDRPIETRVRRSSYGGYLRTTVVNACRNHLRDWRRRRWLNRRLPGRGVHVEPPDEPTELPVELEQLSPRRRAALLLRYYEELDDTTIARILDCREATVRSLVHSDRQLRVRGLISSMPPTRREASVTTWKREWLPRSLASVIVAGAGSVPVLLGGNGVYWGELGVLVTYVVLIVVGIAAVSLTAARSSSTPFWGTARGAAIIAVSLGLPAAVVSTVVVGFATADVLLAAGVPASLHPAMAGSWVFAGALVLTFCAWVIVAPLTWTTARLLSSGRAQRS